MSDQQVKVYPWQIELSRFDAETDLTLRVLQIGYESDSKWTWGVWSDEQEEVDYEFMGDTSLPGIYGNMESALQAAQLWLKNYKSTLK